MAADQPAGEEQRRAAIPRVRNGNGTFIYTVFHAERDEKAARLRADGWSYQRIAEELGYYDKSEARKGIEKVLKATVQEAGDELRRLELARLDGELERLVGLETAVHEVLARKHITVSNGNVIVFDGEPLLDDGPVLNAVDRLLKIEESRRKNGESRRKLLGLDAATKADVTVHEVTQQDVELQEMIRDAKAKAALEEAAIIDGEPLT